MQIYDKLLGQPLFQGMSSGDLQEVVAKVRFGFYKHKRNKTVVEDGQECREILFLLNGTMEVISSPADRSFNVTETISAPAVLQPERLFGLSQRYTRTYRTASPCQMLSIQKDDVLLLSDLFLVFRLNMLNLLTTITHRQQRQLWLPCPKSLSERVVRFFKNHATASLTGKKVFRITMNQLADELNASRLDVSKVLNCLEEEGKIILQRSMVTIPQIECL